jgi:hypothetical protein
MKMQNGNAEWVNEKVGQCMVQLKILYALITSYLMGKKYQLNVELSLVTNRIAWLSKSKLCFKVIYTIMHSDFSRNFDQIKFILTIPKIVDFS